MIPGIIEWAYALVQIIRRKTRRRDWKLKRADYSRIERLATLFFVKLRCGRHDTHHDYCAAFRVVLFSFKIK
jgi:predicted nucleotidyltransferase